MAQHRKMLHRLANSFAVVDIDPADVRHVRSSVDKDKRKGTIHELLNQLLINAERHDGDAIYTALEHSADERLGAPGSWLVEPMKTS